MMPVNVITLSDNLYNMLHGIEPTCEITLNALRINPRAIERFRDAYITYGDEKEPVFVVMTRTGGGNRSRFKDFNDLMTTITGFIDDKDDEFDSTFALFRFVVPDDMRDISLNFLAKAGAPKTLRQKTEDVGKAMATNTMTDDMQRRVSKVASELKGLFES